MKIYNYRSEIDGLRALAVLPVIFFHAGFDLFNGGYVGVDVFFVISGYLITTIILKNLDDKTFSLKNFYERRARRILPALFFVVFISTFFAFVFLTKSELVGYFKSLKATLLFFSNFYFWKTTPYFKSESDFEPLLHTWSLSIEEQFYIIFPITLLLFYKFYKKNILAFFVFIFFLSLLICQFLAIKIGGTFNFYFTFSRFWELSLGAICAYILMYKKIFFSEKVENLLSFFGILMIIFSVFFFDRKTLHPSIYALIPTLGTVLIILFASSNTITKKILSIKIIVGFGLISYSLYLWHQPLLVFGRIFFEDFSNEKKYIILLISLSLSIFSYSFVEKPFRNINKINISIFLKTCSASFVLLILFSLLNVNFFSNKNSTELSLAKLLINNKAIYSVKMDERKFIKNRIIYETLEPKILVIGSSRAMSISKDFFNNQLLNLSVSGASIEDQIAITEMAIEKFQPQTIILGADPWLFNKENGQSRWKSISNEYQLSLKNINLNKKNNLILKNNLEIENYNIFHKYLNWFYNAVNIRKLNYKLENNEIKNPNRNIILRDGTFIFGTREMKKNFKPSLVKYSMNKYAFSPNKYRTYKKFIDYIKILHKKDVILLLTPYHLQSYILSTKANPHYQESEKNFKKLSEETGIQIIGSYNPINTKCGENEFYDPIHPKESCMLKIINQIN